MVRIHFPGIWAVGPIQEVTCPKYPVFVFKTVRKSKALKFR
jgi:hypothetical protein